MTLDPALRAEIRQVTSPANPAVKAVRALHQKKGRAESGRFLAEGLRVLTEAVDLGHRLETLVVRTGARHDARIGRLVAACLDGGGEVLEAGEPVLAKVARKDNPQGAVGVFRQTWTPLDALDPRAAPIWTAIEAPRDPGNVGTLLRTGDAAGAGGAILLDQACDPFSPEGVRASMGSIFAQRLARASLETLVSWCRAGGATLVGASLKGTADYQALAYPQPTVLLLGNEQSGLPPAYEAACDILVRLPMRGRADSLNLAVAGALLLYEVYNQERRRS